MKDLRKKFEENPVDIKDLQKNVEDLTKAEGKSKDALPIAQLSKIMQKQATSVNEMGLVIGTPSAEDYEGLENLKRSRDFEDLKWSIYKVLRFLDFKGSYDEIDTMLSTFHGKESSCRLVVDEVLKWLCVFTSPNSLHGDTEVPAKVELESFHANGKADYVMYRSDNHRGKEVVAVIEAKKRDTEVQMDLCVAKDYQASLYLDGLRTTNSVADGALVIATDGCHWLVEERDNNVVSFDLKSTNDLAGLAHHLKQKLEGLLANAHP